MTDSYATELSKQTPARGRGRGRKGSASARKPAVAATQAFEEQVTSETGVNQEVLLPD